MSRRALLLALAALLLASPAAAQPAPDAASRDVSIVPAAPAPPPAAAAAASTEQPTALFQRANGHYHSGDYAAAAELYRQLANTWRIDDPVLYANLGNTYFRMGDYGSAIFAYRRALRLEPPGAIAERVEANLMVTRRVLEQRYKAGADKSQFVYAEPGGLLHRVSHALGRDVVVYGFLAAWVALFALLAAWRLRPHASARRWGWASLPTGAVALVLGLMLVGQTVAASAFRLGVVIRDGVSLREGRHADARGVALPEGMEVRILDADDDWTRVELANGREGWVETPAVKQI